MRRYEYTKHVNDLYRRRTLGVCVADTCAYVDVRDVGGEEEMVAALFTSQVSTGLGETRRLCSIKVRDTLVLPRCR